MIIEDTQRVNLSDFKIIPLEDTIQRLNLSDKEYFSEKYKDYISNSRLKYVNPEEGGSATIYLNGITNEYTSSLQIGSYVHQLYLQPNEFTLVKDLDKPSAKLGQLIDKIKEFRNENYSIINAIKQASTEIGYYANNLSKSRIKNIIEKGLNYYIKSKDLDIESNIIMTNKESEVCESCLNSLLSNYKIKNTVFPNDEWTKSFNEDAIFLDVLITYQDKSAICKIKMKADNWTIDEDNKVLILNDLKTTSKPVPFFMESYGSFFKYHYSRQMALYNWILQQYCKKVYKYDEE